MNKKNINSIINDIINKQNIKSSLIITFLFSILVLIGFKPKTIKDSSGTKIGFINMIQVQIESKVMQDLNKQNQDFIKTLEKDVENKRKEFAKTESKLQKQQASLSMEAFARKFNEFRNEVMMYDKNTADKLQHAKMIYNDALQEIQKDYLNDIIEDIANRYKYDIVVDANNAKIINSDLDITKQVIDKLDSKIRSKNISKKFKK